MSAVGGVARRLVLLGLVAHLAVGVRGQIEHSVRVAGDIVWLVRHQRVHLKLKGGRAVVVVAAAAVYVAVAHILVVDLVLAELEIGVVLRRLELVGGHREKSERDKLGAYLVEPFVAEGQYLLKQKADDAREVNVAYDHDVEVLEYLELLEVGGRFAVDLRRHLQVLDGPHDRKEDGTATQQVDEKEQLTPREVHGVAFLFLLQKDVANGGQHLSKR